MVHQLVHILCDAASLQHGTHEYEHRHGHEQEHVHGHVGSVGENRQGVGTPQENDEESRDATDGENKRQSRKKENDETAEQEDCQPFRAKGKHQYLLLGASLSTSRMGGRAEGRQGEQRSAPVSGSSPAPERGPHH
ncbi:MAG: hypothetical protein R3D67_14395 [Hyphomicrobiaceae bacterium]